MVKTLVMLDICLFLVRRFVFTTFHIKLRNFFITVLVLKACVALTKAIINYIVSVWKDSKNKSSEQEIGELSKHPHLRVVK